MLILSTQKDAAGNLGRFNFDTDKRFIPMSDGWVLDTARIHAEPLPPDPKRPVTRKVGSTIRYEEGADPIQYPQRWMNWLDTFVPDEGEQRFLQDAAGAALVGATAAFIKIFG